MHISPSLPPSLPPSLLLSSQSNVIEQVDWVGLDRLRFLDLSENKLTSIHSLGACPALLELTVAENRLARISKSQS